MSAGLAASFVLNRAALAATSASTTASSSDPQGTYCNGAGSL
jgi:hypothetical protein